MKITQKLSKNVIFYIKIHIPPRWILFSSHYDYGSCTFVFHKYDRLIHTYYIGFDIINIVNLSGKLELLLLSTLQCFIIKAFWTEEGESLEQCGKMLKRYLWHLNECTKIFINEIIDSSMLTFWHCHHRRSPCKSKNI